MYYVLYKTVKAEFEISVTGMHPNRIPRNYISVLSGGCLSCATP